MIDDTLLYKINLNTVLDIQYILNILALTFLLHPKVRGFFTLKWVYFSTVISLSVIICFLLTGDAATVGLLQFPLKIIIINPS
jgi:hypothetical protein